MKKKIIRSRTKKVFKVEVLIKLNGISLTKTIVKRPNKMFDLH